jgi:hypothetical protein
LEPYNSRTITKEEIEATTLYKEMQNVTHLDATNMSLELYAVHTIAQIAATLPYLEVIKLNTVHEVNYYFTNVLNALAQSPSIHTIDISNNNNFYDNSGATWLDVIEGLKPESNNVRTFIMCSNELFCQVPGIVAQVCMKFLNLRHLDLSNNNFLRDSEKYVPKYEEYIKEAKLILDKFNKNPTNILKITENYSLLFGAWALSEHDLPKDVTNLILGDYSIPLEYEL